MFPGRELYMRRLLFAHIFCRSGVCIMRPFSHNVSSWQNIGSYHIMYHIMSNHIISYLVSYNVLAYHIISYRDKKTTNAFFSWCEHALHAAHGSASYTRVPYRYLHWAFTVKLSSAHLASCAIASFEGDAAQSIVNFLRPIFPRKPQRRVLRHGGSIFWLERFLNVFAS